MNMRTIAALNAVNRRFYRRHWQAFDRSRRQPWPGWGRTFELFSRHHRCDRPHRILDVGCGNGRWLAFLSARDFAPGLYCGVDASLDLLLAARRRARRTALPHPPLWVAADVVESLPPVAGGEGFCCIAVFGLLHHVPEARLRRSLLAALAARLAAGGMLVVTYWRFAGRRRFASRAIPWSRLPEIDRGDLDGDDRLLAWGSEGGLRYCRAVGEREAVADLDGLGLERLASFLADGDGGELNRYYVLRRP